MSLLGFKTRRTKRLLGSFKEKKIPKVGVYVRKVEVYPHEEKPGYWVAVVVFDDNTKEDFASSIITLLCSDLCMANVTDFTRQKLVSYQMAERIEIRNKERPEVEAYLDKYCYLAC